MSKKYHAALIKERVQGYEYRAFVIDGATKFIYKKDKVEKCYKNIDTFRKELIQENIRRRDIGLNQFDLSSKFIKRIEGRILLSEPIHFDALNVSSGHASITEILTEIPEFIAQLSDKISKVTTLRVLAYDFISLQETINDIHDYVVLEVNGNPMLESLDLANMQDLKMSIWSEILQKAFVK